MLAAFKKTIPKSHDFFTNHIQISHSHFAHSWENIVGDLLSAV